MCREKLLANNRILPIDSFHEQWRLSNSRDLPVVRPIVLSPQTTKVTISRFVNVNGIDLNRATCTGRLKSGFELSEEADRMSQAYNINN